MSAFPLEPELHFTSAELLCLYSYFNGCCEIVPHLQKQWKIRISPSFANHYEAGFFSTRHRYSLIRCPSFFSGGCLLIGVRFGLSRILLFLWEFGSVTLFTQLHPRSTWLCLSPLLWCPFAAYFHLYAVRLSPFFSCSLFVGFIVGSLAPLSHGLFYSVAVTVLHFLEALRQCGEIIFLHSELRAQKGRVCGQGFSSPCLCCSPFFNLLTVFQNLVSSGFVVLGLFLLWDSWGLTMSDICMLVPLVQPNPSLWIQHCLYSLVLV